MLVEAFGFPAAVMATSGKGLGRLAFGFNDEVCGWMGHPFVDSMGGWATGRRWASGMATARGQDV